jgi:phosphomannomutase
MAIKFGTDGWRGLTDKDFNDENVSIAIQAIANCLTKKNKNTLVIGYDGRKKADYFAKLAAQIFAANGFSVMLVDKPCPTPATGWSIIDKKADGAVMFTASHNPAEFLGLKFMTEEATVAPTEITDAFTTEIDQIDSSQIKKADFEKAIVDGTIVIFDPKPSYFAKLTELVDIEKIKKSGLNVLLNPMNGAGVGYLSEILSGGNLQITSINDSVEPDFGGLTPEPIVLKNVQDAITEAKTGKYSVCLSSDGDADRIGLIDEKGEMITSLEAFLILTYYFLVHKKQLGPIVRTLSNTIMVDHLCAKLNQPVFETKVGFKWVAEKMKEANAVFGGEESGGSAISNFMLVRDAQIMNLFILDLLADIQKPLSEILIIAEEAAGGAYKFSREDVHFDYDKYEEVKNEKAALLAANPPTEILGKKVVKTRTDDGLKLFFEDDAWVLLRFSGTEPVLRLYAEAKTGEEVTNLLEYLKNYFK